MEFATIGEVPASAIIENLKDLYDVEEGRLSATEVRRVNVDDALVDTGATLLSLPKRYIKQLGLTQVRERTARTAAGVLRSRIGGEQMIELYSVFSPARSADSETP